MEDALRGVLDEHLSFQQAAEKFGVPRSTLHSKYLGRHSDMLGKPPAIPFAEETLIAKAMLTAAEFGVPFTESILKDFVEQYINREGVVVKQFRDNRPGSDWCYYFLLRNPELSKRNSQNIKRCRAELTPTVITEYFANLLEIVRGVPPANISNYDETNMTDDPGSQKIFVRSRVNKWQTFTPIYRSQSEIALPALRRNDGKKVIIGNNLESHLSYKVIKACEENNISFVFLPKYSTHLCQPLDVAVFGPIKISWRKVLTDWKLHSKGVIPKQVYPSLPKKMLANCREKMSANILSGFEATGISPFNPEKVLTKIRPRNDEANQNNPAMVESFSNILTELTRENERPAITRKIKIYVPSGKSIGLANLEVEADVIPTTSTLIHIDDPQYDSDHSSRSSVVNETEDDIMTPVETASDIHESDFVLTSFIYNAGTKKETRKLFVAQIMHMKKSCIEIKCLRTYNGKKCAFVFPDVESVKMSQIKYRLCEPQETRGIFTFLKMYCNFL
ncbi:hypothetical protein JTB14_028053 [Gonioctena quinquepunctata]|nr:hypothetical protein JTB14_028053 [Gonioctena quinquepunctata]